MIEAIAAEGEVSKLVAAEEDGGWGVAARPTEVSCRHRHRCRHRRRHRVLRGHLRHR